MRQNINNSENKIFFLQLAIIFILVELLDFYLDSVLGLNLFHTIIQIILYLILFIVSIFLFNMYYKKKVEKLLLPELMQILKLLQQSDNNKIMINNKHLLTTLKITKPTLKKRVEVLTNLGYLTYDKIGNRKYLKLTLKGKSYLK